MTRIARLLTIMCLAVAMAGGGAAHSAFASGPQTLTVSTCDEAHLDAAVATANADNAGDTIKFSCSGTITLTSMLTVGGSMTIDGSGQNVVIDGGHTSTTSGVQIMTVNPGVTLSLGHLTLQHGNATYGGAILNNGGMLTVTNSTFSGNSATPGSGDGGAIYNNCCGTLTIDSSTLSGNTAYQGGAIENSGSSTLTITASTLSGNAGPYGGAISSNGSLTITASTLANNSATDGGAIINSSLLTITNSTLSGNSASYSGGAIYNGGALTVTNSTLSFNSAASVGGAVVDPSGDVANFGASILAYNTGGNCYGTIIDQGYNLESGTDCGFTATSSHQSTNPQFAAAGLANNGGPTPTIALQSTSPAIDKIPTGTLNCAAGGTDQRGTGYPRPDNNESKCDIGAYEFQDPSLPTPTLTTTASPAITLDATVSPTLTDTAVLSGGNNPTGSITFTLSHGGTTVYTATDSVSGNASYSASHTLPATGTVTGTYTWSASYGGDTNNAGAHDQGGTAEQTVVSQASPGLTTTASPSSPTAGQTLKDTATFSGGYAPTGSIVFTLHQGSCTGTAVDTETVSVSGNGAYNTPAGYPNAAAGSYDWVASYGGDGNNQGATSSCEPVTVSAAIPSLTITPATASVSEGATSANVATFTDPDNNTDPTKYQASITWGDNATGTCSVSGSAQPFTVSCTHSGALDEGSIGYTVKITDSDSATGTATGTVTVTDAALTPGSATTFNATEGQQFSGTIGSFTDANTSASTSDFSVSINWGDGSPADTTSGQVTESNGTFTVSGTHTYSEPKTGGYAVSISVTDDGGSRTTLSSTATVGDAALSTPTSQTPFSTTEGNAFSGVVGTFFDSNPNASANDYPAASVTIAWGDGASSNGTVAANTTITPPSGTLAFDVSGSHTYTDEGNQAVTVSVTDIDGATTSFANTAQVQDAALTPGSKVTLSPIQEGQSTGTVTLGTFTDANPGDHTSDFSVSIDWGDGSTASSGNVTYASGIYTVTGSHTYTDESATPYGITATVTDKGSSTTKLNTSITVKDAALTLTSTAGQINTTEGSTVSQTLATFTDANPDATAGDYTVSIDWGDGASSTGTVQVDANVAGQWDVLGSHAYPEEGTSYPVTITITDDGASSLNTSTTATVADAALTGTSTTFNAVESTAFSGPIGSFTDANTGATTTDYTVDIQWGDGASITGCTTCVTGSGGTFTVTVPAGDAHTYADGGNYPVGITVRDDGGAKATFQSTADVADPAPSLSTNAGATQSVEYSDPISAVTITGTDIASDMPLAATASYTYNGGAALSGLPSGLTLSDPSGCNPTTPTCTWTVAGSMNVAPGTYVVTVSAEEAGAAAGDNAAGPTSFTITVGQEAAAATYSGSSTFSTASPTSSSYTLNLSATIQDLGGSGETPGNITNATVTFVNRDAGNAPLVGCENLPVGLVNSSDTTTGSASCTATGSLSTTDMSNGGTTFNLGIIVGYNAGSTTLTGYDGSNGWYTDDSSAEDSTVTITVPLTSNVTNGGGWILLQNSAGQYAGDTGSHTNFGLTFKYNKKGTNPQGGFNGIFRRTEADGVHTYQIKSNSINSFTTNAKTGTASINTKATLIDITNPLAPVSIDGGASLQIDLTATSHTFPGSIAIQITSKSGGTYFSSDWTGTTTSQTNLSGGHLTVS